MPSDSERNCDRCNCLITGKDYHTIKGLLCDDCATGTQAMTPSDRDQSQQDREEKPELPKGWKPPFSLEVSMHDGRFYLRNADGESLEFDNDHDGSTLVLGGNPEPMEAIAFALNMAYGDAK